MMDAMTLLLERQSQGQLDGPAPKPEQLDYLYRAALRAPDHGELRPWHFIEYSSEGRKVLGEIFAQAELADNLDASEVTLEKARSKPLRAPMIIAVIASVKASKKVPRIEQVISAGCAAHAMLYAARALGLGAMWRTGGYAHHESVHKGMGLGPDDALVGFLYLGHSLRKDRECKALVPADFVERIGG